MSQQQTHRQQPREQGQRQGQPGQGQGQQPLGGGLAKVQVLPPTRGGGPLSSHPPTPIFESAAFEWPEEPEEEGEEEEAYGDQQQQLQQEPQQEQEQEQQKQQQQQHGREVSGSSLPYLDNSSVGRHSHRNLSTPDLLTTTTTTTTTSTTLETLHDSKSNTPNSSFHLFHSAPGQLSKSSTFTMSSSTHDLRHDSAQPTAATAATASPSHEYGNTNTNNKGSFSRRDSKGVRKLFTLAGFRNSFSTSRSSLAISSPIPHLPPATPSRPQHQQQQEEEGAQSEREGSRPNSGSSTSSRGVKRAAEDDHDMPDHDDAQHQQLQPPLRKRKSGSWFRRKSIIMFGGHITGDIETPPQGPDAIMTDAPASAPAPAHAPSVSRPTTQTTTPRSRTPSSNNNIPIAASSPPKLPPLPRLSTSKSSHSQTSSHQHQHQHQHQQFVPPSRDAFSPPPILPELGGFGEEMGDDMFKDIGR